MRATLTLLALATVAACSAGAPRLTDAAKIALADTAKSVVQGAMGSADKLDFNTYFQTFSDDPDAKFAEAGSLYPSLGEMKKGRSGT